MTHDQGIFGWKRRMGVHEAYHQNKMNRIFHFVCIPFQLFAVVLLLSRVSFFGSVDLAILSIVILSPVYLLTEILLGSCMVAFLGFCWFVSTNLIYLYSWVTTIAVILFVIAFTFQVFVGHSYFEAGRDDTNKNLAELARSKNPIPIVLIFYNHLVEVAQVVFLSSVNKVRAGDTLIELEFPLLEFTLTYYF